MTESIPTSEPLQQDMTEVGDFDRITDGYIVIAPLPDDVKQSIYDIQGALAAHINPDALWLPKGDQLHVTFAHIVSPDAEYERDKSDVFSDALPQAKNALSHIAETVSGDVVQFNQIKVFPSAIILEGVDDGTMALARQQFTQEFTVPEGTRKPPAIIHTTIARFREELPMEVVQTALAGVSPQIITNIDKLQLIHERAMYTQSHEVIEEF